MYKHWLKEHSAKKKLSLDLVKLNVKCLVKMIIVITSGGKCFKNSILNVKLCWMMCGCIAAELTSVLYKIDGISKIEHQ